MTLWEPSKKSLCSEGVTVSNSVRVDFIALMMDSPSSQDTAPKTRNLRTPQSL